MRLTKLCELFDYVRDTHNPGFQIRNIGKLYLDVVQNRPEYAQFRQAEYIGVVTVAKVPLDYLLDVKKMVDLFSPAADQQLVSYYTRQQLSVWQPELLTLFIPPVGYSQVSEPCHVILYLRATRTQTMELLHARCNHRLPVELYTFAAYSSTVGVTNEHGILMDPLGGSAYDPQPEPSEFGGRVLNHYRLRKLRALVE